MKINPLYCLFSIAFPFHIAAQTLEATEDSSVVEVTLTDFQLKPLYKEKVIFEGVNSKAKFKGITNKNGKFSILLPEGDTYNVKYINVAEEVEYSQMQVDKEPGIFTYSLDLKYQPEKEYTLKNVYFDTGKATLKKESYKELNELAELLTRKESMEIEIGGYTDNVGEDDVNQQISQARADEVKKYLVSKGIAPQRIKATGYGNSKPVADNSNETGRQKNRRTEVHIIKE